MHRFFPRLWLFLVCACALIATSERGVTATVPATDIPASVSPGMVQEPDVPEEEESDVPTKSAPLTPPHIPVPTKPSATPTAPVNPDEFQTVILRVLNKVTARTQEIEAPIGSVMRSGTIEIIAHTCWKSAPGEQPENAALLEISEIHQGEAPVRIFLGWIFSSSPAISGLEDPFYDVTIVRCEKSDKVQ